MGYRNVIAAVCKDKNIGTWKGQNAEPIAGNETLYGKSETITVFCLTERDAIVPMKRIKPQRDRH